MNDKKNKKEQPVRQLNREEWIARAVAAAAMSPGKRKPAATRPIDKD